MKESKSALWQITASSLLCLLLLAGFEGIIRWTNRDLESGDEASFIRKNRLHWFHLTTRRGADFTEKDPDLLWKNRPGIDSSIFVYSLWDQSGEGTYFPAMKWQTSPEGIVGAREAIPSAKPSTERRILSLGDSSTVGLALLDREALYTQQTAEMLQHSEKEGATYRPINLGVIGYSSAQGLRQLQLRGEALQPDILLTYFGNNDGALHGEKDDDAIMAFFARHGKQPGWIGSLQKGMDSLYAYRFLRAKMEKPLRLGEKGKVLRVNPEKYGQNLRSMAEWARRHNAQIVFLEPPTNLLFPPLYGGMVPSPDLKPFPSHAGMVGSYPGNGTPVLCYEADDCVNSFLGNWFVTNAPGLQVVNGEISKVLDVRYQTPIWAARREELRGNLTKAKEQYAALLANAGPQGDPLDRATLLNNLGVVQKKLGDVKSAKASLEEAMSLNPESPFPYFNLGSIALEEGDALNGFALLEKALPFDHFNLRFHTAYRDMLAQTARDVGAPLVSIREENLANMAKTGRGEFFVDVCHPSKIAMTLLSEKTAAAIRALPALQVAKP